MGNLRDEISFAAKQGDTEKVLTLLNSGVSINIKDSLGNSLLKSAFMGTDMYKGVKLGTIRTLISRGIDVNLKNNYGKDALYDAANSYIFKNGNRAFELLLNSGADLNSRYDDDKTILMVLCERGIVNAVKTLVEKGADLNLQDSDGNTALHKSLERGSFGNTYNNISQMLISNGADLSIKNKDGKTALENIFLNGKKEYMDLIISLAVCKDLKNIDICLTEYCKLVNKYELSWNVNNSANFGSDKNLKTISQSIEKIEDLETFLKSVKRAIKTRFSNVDNDNLRDGVKTINKYIEEVNKLHNQYMVNTVVLPIKNINREQI